jgi:uncharacterized DUF497 family protein
MEFEWDEEKSEACFQERGFDFAFAAKVFFDPERTVQPDNRMIYGEARYQVYGTVTGRLFVVVFTQRGGRIRIISARKANQREVRRYGRLQN